MYQPQITNQLQFQAHVAIEPTQNQQANKTTLIIKPTILPERLVQYPLKGNSVRKMRPRPSRPYGKTLGGTKKIFGQSLSGKTVTQRQVIQLESEQQIVEVVNKDNNKKKCQLEMIMRYEQKKALFSDSKSHVGQQDTHIHSQSRVEISPKQPIGSCSIYNP